MTGMGTRGFVGIVVDGVEKIMYNHNSSYPDSLGVDVLDDLVIWTARPYRELVDAARILCDPCGAPIRDVLETHPLLRERFERHPDWTMWQRLDDSDADTWYEVLRFGGLDTTLRLGLYQPDPHFPVAGGWCEWGYLVDLDADNGPDQPPGRFEMYRGMRPSVPTDGRWAGRPTRTENAADHRAHLAFCDERGIPPWLPKTPRFKAVHLAASWTLSSLPTPEELLAAGEAARS